MPSNLDIDLISKLCHDDVRAFDKLYDIYSNKLYRFAFSLLKNNEDSEGIVQETFLRIWTNRKGLNPSKSFKSYIFAICYNLIIDKLRKGLKEKEFLNNLGNYFNAATVSVENEVDYNIIKSQIDELVEELPKKRKVIYKLSREKGLSHKEISEHLNISVKTVENQINLALRFLKERLDYKNITILLFVLLCN
jgi:RNA polymerase sigma-70 factor (family 1)